MSEPIEGFWHKIRFQCDKCGLANPNGTTFVVDSELIKGKFCCVDHAEVAYEEMQTGKIKERSDE